MATGVGIRYDDGRQEFVLEVSIPGLRDFQVSNATLSQAFLEMSEELENENV